MKQLSSAEVAEMATPVPPMSKKDKLMRLAQIVRKSSFHFYLYHLLERQTPETWAETSISGSAFDVAARDPILQDAGFAGNTIADAKKFFELTREELHEFSCDCGGQLTNANMADRIEKIAGGPAPSFFNRLIDSASWTGRR